MTCDRFTKSIPQMMSAAEGISPEAALHLAECRSCSAEYAAYCRTVQALKQWNPAVSTSEERSLDRLQAEGFASGASSRRAAGASGAKGPFLRRRGLFRPLSWHWSAQFVAAALLGGMAGLWLMQSLLKPSDYETFSRAPELRVPLTTPQIWNGAVYDQGTGPVSGFDALEGEAENSRWKAHLGYVRLRDQLDGIFGKLPNVRYYLHPSLEDRRISPLLIKEGIPFSPFLQRLAHASTLEAQNDASGRTVLVRTEGALMYRRGPIYYFVPKQEGISPWHTDLYRAIQSNR